MSAVLSLDRGIASPGQLSVERTDIAFVGRTVNTAAFEVAIRNEGEGPTQATVATIEAAPLGAFVPWQPLLVMPVPRLRAGESHVLQFSAARPAVKPLGPPDRVPPRLLLTALGFEGERRKPQDQPTARPGDVGSRLLPADLMQLLVDEQLYWAGNLNVHVGGRAVERHLAQALRIYPGRTNMAWFMVGCGADQYRFHITGIGPDWNAKLFDMFTKRSLLVDLSAEQPVEVDSWIPVTSTAMMLLALSPPADCGAGTVEVQVTQRSSGQTAVVEFSCDPRAAGPGCYAVK